ncbi:pyrroloquinoline quinone biosynthesis protein PqqE [Caenispirillum bisanense]|uniref:pyrroloquinoline quinone biosynthesis protein PqqE n=1 Tax=Caenispirillum bisanense TaxID=414052 RepID=UPI0031D4D136
MTDSPRPDDLPLPVAILAELTHRCPMRCAYCSNPLALDAVEDELTTAEWTDVLRQAAALGVMQVHFSGGEPAARPDLEALVAAAVEAGLYANLITSGLGLDAARLQRLAALGLDHVQLSIQDTDDAGIAWVTGVPRAFDRKLAVAAAVRQAGLALTCNLVITRRNAGRVGALIDLAAELGAGRCEVANVQYYGWGLRNRALLMPTIAQLEAMTAVVEERRAHYRGRLVIDYVVPDYYARRPKACMAGWGRRFLNVTPTGTVLPCHAAESIPGLSFETVRQRSLRAIWTDGAAFRAFRGTDWMPETCRTCDRREVDWGGCRCQALALTGDAAAMDPACAFSPHHDAMRALAEAESAAAADDGGTPQYRLNPRRRAAAVAPAGLDDTP